MRCALLLSLNWLFSLARVLQAEPVHPHSFPEKCQHLKSVQERLREESSSLKAQHWAGLRDILAAQQVPDAAGAQRERPHAVLFQAEPLPFGPDSLVRLPQSLQAQIKTGQQRLQALLCQAVQEATEEQK